MSQGYGGGIRLATWAIRQMTGDFDVHDIATVFAGLGIRCEWPKLSAILNRMKEERKLTEVWKGGGRTHRFTLPRPK